MTVEYHFKAMIDKNSQFKIYTQQNTLEKGI